MRQDPQLSEVFAKQLTLVVVLALSLKGVQRMSKEQQLAVIDFGPADLRTLDEIASQVNACKQASDKAGRAAHVLTVFLKMVDEKLSSFVKDLRERMRAERTA